MQEERSRFRARRVALAAVAGAMLMLAAPGVGWAQPVPLPPQGNLGSLLGQTGLQQRTGIAIGSLNPSGICPKLNTSLSGARDNGTAAGDLLGRCQDLIQTANFINNGPLPSTIFNLGLTIGETNDAINDLDTRQTPAVGRAATEMASVQLAVLSERLVALREGAPGIQIAGLLRDGQGREAPLAFEGALSEDAAAGDDGGFLSRLGVFLNGNGSFGDRSGSAEELGFDFHYGGVTLGADYRFLESLFAGLAFNYTNFDRSFDGSRGSLDANAYGVSLYGGYQWEGFYLDGIFSYAFNNLDLKRRIVYTAAPDMGVSVNRTASGDTDANEYTLAAGTGYDWSFEGFTLGPLAGIEYIRLDIDDFSEGGAFGLDLTHDDDQIESLRFNLGAQILYAISTSFGVFTPQLRWEWEHQFLDDPRTVSARFTADPTSTPIFVVTDKPDRDYMDFSAGVVATLAEGWSAFVDYETVLFHKRLAQHVFTGGVRFQF